MCSWCCRRGRPRVLSGVHGRKVEANQRQERLARTHTRLNGCPTQRTKSYRTLRPLAPAATRRYSLYRAVFLTEVYTRPVFFTAQTKFFVSSSWIIYLVMAPRGHSPGKEDGGKAEPAARPPQTPKPAPRLALLALFCVAGCVAWGAVFAYCGKTLRKLTEELKSVEDTVHSNLQQFSLVPFTGRYVRACGCGCGCGRAHVCARTLCTACTLTGNMEATEDVNEYRDAIEGWSAHFNEVR